MTKKEKIKFIEENIHFGVEYVSEKTGLTPYTIKRYAREYLGIREREYWTEEDINFLKDNYHEHGAFYCSKKLKRTINSIYFKCDRLKIRNKSYIRHEKKDCSKGYHYCWCCKQELTESKFYLRRPKRGDIQLTHICKNCYLQRHKREYTPKTKWSILYRNNPEKAMYIQSKGGAKRRGLEFNITEEDIIIPEKCPVLGIDIIPFSASDNSPSLDRIDNNKGYVKGNVKVISKRANLLKSNATKEELLKICEYMEREGF